MSDPFERSVVPLVQLRQRVTDALAAHGLVLIRMLVSPGESVASPHEIQITAGLADDWNKRDDGFDEVLDSARLADVEIAADEVRAQLTDRLRERFDGGDDLLPPPPTSRSTE